LGGGFPKPNFLAIEDNQAAALHGGVALHHLHVAGKRRGFTFVMNLERGRLDLYWRIPVLGLQRFCRA
jgi:hypothetical protein